MESSKVNNLSNMVRLLDQATSNVREVAGVEVSEAFRRGLAELFCLERGEYCKREWQGMAAAEVLPRLMSGGSVILNAPTGSGKTLFAILVALIAQLAKARVVEVGGRKMLEVPSVFFVSGFAEHGRRYLEDFAKIVVPAATSKCASDECKRTVAEFLWELAPVPRNSPVYACPLAAALSKFGIDPIWVGEDRFSCRAFDSIDRRNISARNVSEVISVVANTLLSNEIPLDKTAAEAEACAKEIGIDLDNNASSALRDPWSLPGASLPYYVMLGTTGVCPYAFSSKIVHVNRIVSSTTVFPTVDVTCSGVSFVSGDIVELMKVIIQLREDEAERCCICNIESSDFLDECLGVDESCLSAIRVRLVEKSSRRFVIPSIKRDSIQCSGKLVAAKLDVIFVVVDEGHRFLEWSRYVATVSPELIPETVDSAVKSAKELHSSVTLMGVETEASKLAKSLALLTHAYASVATLDVDKIVDRLGEALKHLKNIDASQNNEHTYIDAVSKLVEASAEAYGRAVEIVDTVEEWLRRASTLDPNLATAFRIYSSLQGSSKSICAKLSAMVTALRSAKLTQLERVVRTIRNLVTAVSHISHTALQVVGIHTDILHSCANSSDDADVDNVDSADKSGNKLFRDLMEFYVNYDYDDAVPRLVTRLLAGFPYAECARSRIGELVMKIRESVSASMGVLKESGIENVEGLVYGLAIWGKPIIPMPMVRSSSLGFAGAYSFEPKKGWENFAEKIARRQNIEYNDDRRDALVRAVAPLSLLLGIDPDSLIDMYTGFRIEVAFTPVVLSLPAMYMSGSLPAVASKLLNGAAYVNVSDAVRRGEIRVVPRDMKIRFSDVARNPKLYLAKLRDEYARFEKPMLVAMTWNDYEVFDRWSRDCVSSMAEECRRNKALTHLAKWFLETMPRFVTNNVNALKRLLETYGVAAVSLFGSVSESMEVLEGGRSMIRSVVVLRLTPGETSPLSMMVASIIAHRLGVSVEDLKSMIALIRVAQILGRSVRSEYDRATAVILDGAKLREMVKRLGVDLVRQLGLRI